MVFNERSFFVPLVDIITDNKLERHQAIMRGGAGSRAPPRAIYTPGSGPLKKSGRSSLDEYNGEERPRVSIQDRLKPQQFTEILPTAEMEKRLNNLQINERHVENDNVADGVGMANDLRRRNKKPEQQLYVPKKVQEALAERDVANR